MNLFRMSDGQISTIGVVGTITTWSLQGTLSLIATVCTIIVVGPKAWEQVADWAEKYGPKVKGWFKRD